ncbi:dihydroxyacetone kinase subunit DhaL [Candidatus Hydrogenedentota bacterium]
MALDTIDLVQWKIIVSDICEMIEEKKDHLSKLDAACGDGDHGVSMARGFRAVSEKLDRYEASDIGALLKMVGMTLVSVIGGATGPLFGTIFMRAGIASAGMTETSSSHIAEMFSAALEGIQERGKAQVGDKTMVDALSPAVDSVHTSAAEGRDVVETLDLAVKAARAGADATADMLARQGKGRYLGERALGCQDAGANSIYHILESMYGSVKEST